MMELLKLEFGLMAEALQPLSGGRMNRLFKVGEWVVKRYDHRQVPPERAERAVRLQEMAAARGLPVPAPLRTQSGPLWAPSEEGMVVVMPFVPGARRVRGELNPTEAAHLGLLLGRLHAMLRTVPLDPGSDPSPPSPDAVVSRWQHLRQQALSVQTPTEFDRAVLEAAEYVSGSLARMPQAGWAAGPWQLCHGDLHLDNVLFHEDGPVAALLDFDNAVPGWAGVELMMAWNLCFCTDPGKPSLTPEGARFFAAYREGNDRAGDLTGALRAYWFTLISNTWPAAIRYREGAVKPEWVEILSMRHRAAQWLEANLAAVAEWLER